MSRTSAVMIDIETLDTKPTAAVLQIAAVAFTYTQKGAVRVVDEFDIKLDAGCQINAGRTVSADTLSWWLNHWEQAQLLGGLIGEGAAPRNVFPSQLEAFKEWLANHQGEVWSQGPTFDLIILESLYESFDISLPFKYFSVRDLRTIQNFVGMDDKAREIKKSGVTHNALEDCHTQIKLLSHYLKKAAK